MDVVFQLNGMLMLISAAAGFGETTLAVMRPALLCTVLIGVPIFNRKEMGV